MKNPTLAQLATITTGLALLAAAIITTGSTPRPPAPADQIGRYQLHLTPHGHPILLDSTTGHTWLGRPDRTNMAQYWYPFPAPPK